PVSAASVSVLVFGSVCRSGRHHHSRPRPRPRPRPRLRWGWSWWSWSGGWFVVGLTQQEGGGDAGAEVPEITGVTALPIGPRGGVDQTVDLHRHIGGQIDDAHAFYGGTPMR